jgi:hypothetical protein
MLLTHIYILNRTSSPKLLGTTGTHLTCFYFTRTNCKFTDHTLTHTVIGVSVLKRLMSRHLPQHGCIDTPAFPKGGGGGGGTRRHAADGQGPAAGTSGAQSCGCGQGGRNTCNTCSTCSRFGSALVPLSCRVCSALAPLIL